MITIEEAIQNPSFGMMFINGFEPVQAKIIFNEWLSRIDPVLVDKTIIDYCAYRLLHNKSIKELLTFDIDDVGYLKRAYCTDSLKDQSVVYCLAYDSFEKDSSLFPQGLDGVPLENVNYVASLNSDVNFNRALITSGKVNENLISDNPLLKDMHSSTGDNQGLNKLLPDTALEEPHLNHQQRRYLELFGDKEDVHPDYLEFYGLQGFNKHQYAVRSNKKHKVYFVNDSTKDGQQTAGMFADDTRVADINYTFSDKTVSARVDLIKGNIQDMNEPYHFVFYFLLLICKKHDVKKLITYKPESIINTNNNVDLDEAKHILRVGRFNVSPRRIAVLNRMKELGITKEDQVVNHLREIQGTQHVNEPEHLDDFLSSMSDLQFSSKGNTFRRKL